MSEGSARGPRVIVVAARSELLTQVIDMGDRYRRTLGPPLPPVVFETRAEAGGVLAAINHEGTLLGYALFEIAKNRVRLVHLCVDSNGRKNGTARMLVDEITHRHGDLPGITVSCRSDYPAAAVWPRLGFSCTNEKPGRGNTGKTLQIWWRSHAVEDLFSHLEESDELVVAIDHNVFIDLVVQPLRSGAEKSAVLKAGHLDGMVRLAVTKETFNEIADIQDAAERKRQRALARGFHQLDSTPKRLQILREATEAQLAPVLAGSDYLHLLHAAAAGASVFVTRDDDLIRNSENIAYDKLALRVVHPETLVLYLAEIEDAERFRPASLHATRCAVQDSTAGIEGRFAHLLATGGGERRKDYNSALRRLASTPETRIRHVTDAAGQVLVAWAESRQAKLEIPLLRISTDALADTVLRLFLFEMRSVCLAEQLPSVVVTDPHSSSRVVSALAEDGFQHSSGLPEAFVCPTLSRRATAELLPAGLSVRDELLNEATALGRLAVLEADLWPCKLLDVDIPNWIIPIRPVWARELLRLDDPLLPRPELLGLSRELVYYRSGRGGPSGSPGRVLWYASDTTKRGIGAVVGCSQIVGVVKDDPDRLYRRFQHLGVYQRTNVHDAAGADGRASAIRFVNTELFDDPVAYETVEQLSRSRRIGPLQSPTAVDAELFGAVYQQGTKRS
jgi:predicted nucleic acid-binding protein